jgi:hypothetical protein
MANKLQVNTEDTVVLLDTNEYAALVSLLHELQEPEKLTRLAEEHRLMLSAQQIHRIAGLWSSLEQRSAR